MILVPSLFVFTSFFKALPLAWGDAPFYYPEGLRELTGGLTVWGERGDNFGDKNLALWLSPLMALYGSLNKFFGLGNDTIVRILFYFPSVIFAGLGSYFLARYFKLSKIGQFFSSLVYLLNTYFLLLIDGGQVGISLSYGIFPFTVLFWLRFFDNLSVKRFFMALVASLALSLTDPRVAIISFLFIFLWQVAIAFLEKKAGYIKNLVWPIVAGFLLIPLNMYWLLPLIKGGSGGVSTSVTNLQLSSLLNSLLMFSPHWPSNLFGKVNPPYFYFVLIPVFIFGVFLFKKTKRENYVLGFIFLFFAFIAKGTTPPLGNWYEQIISSIPFGSIFRDSTKFFVPMTLTAGILIGQTIDSVLTIFDNKIVKNLLFGFCYFYLMFLIFPAISGKMNFNLSTRSDNPDYKIIYEHLKKENGSFRTLWFNEKPQTAFETSEKPALSANQLTSFRPFASMNEGEDPYNFLNNSESVDWLKNFGVRYIILSGDPRNIFPSEKDIENWQEEIGLISGTHGLVEENWGTKTPVFRIDGQKSEKYPVKKITLVIGSDLSPRSKVPAAVYPEDGKFDPNILKDLSPGSYEVMMNGGNRTDFVMSFLQKYFKSPDEASNSEWATFTSSQYLKYKYELLIRGIKFRDFDYGRGVAFSSKPGEKIKFIFNIPLEGNYIIAKRAANLQTQKLTWEFEEKTLKAGDFELAVENKSGLTVINTVAVFPAPEFSESMELAEKLISSTEPPAGNNWIIHTQNFDKDWIAEPVGIHVPVFSMINGYYTGPAPEVNLRYEAEKNLELGSKISLGSAAVLFAAYLGATYLEHIKRSGRAVK